MTLVFRFSDDIISSHTTQRRPTMDITEEEFLTNGLPDEDVSREAWPIPPSDNVKDFEEFLMDLGLRF